MWWWWQVPARRRRPYDMQNSGGVNHLPESEDEQQKGRVLNGLIKIVCCLLLTKYSIIKASDFVASKIFEIRTEFIASVIWNKL